MHWRDGKPTIGPSIDSGYIQGKRLKEYWHLFYSFSVRHLVVLSIFCYFIPSCRCVDVARLGCLWSGLRQIQDRSDVRAHISKPNTGPKCLPQGQPASSNVSGLSLPRAQLASACQSQDCPFS